MLDVHVPYVLECMRFVADSSSYQQRVVKNYEFDLYLDGNRSISVDGVSYSDIRKCLVFRKPGQITTGNGDYNMYLMTFAFDNEGVSDGERLYRSVSGKCQKLCEDSGLDEIPSVFSPSHFDEMKELMEKISRCSYPGIEDTELQKQYMREFLYLVLYDASRYKRVNEERKYSVNSYVKKACNYIALNFDRDIRVGDIAKELHINENHFIKLFKKEMACTPNSYISETRLIHARQLILQTNLPIEECAFKCGFNTPSYFTKRFKNRFGVLPCEMRREFT